MLEVSAATVVGECLAPPSKSETHRALLIASLADGPVTIERPLLAADTRASLAAAAAFGCRVEELDDGLQLWPGFDDDSDLELDCGNSGTTLRLACGIAAARRGRTHLDGDDSLRRRPMAPLLATLDGAGAIAESRSGRPPLSVRGPLRARHLRVDGGQSSQFVSSALLALTAAGGGICEVVGEVASQPYLELTLRCLDAAGVHVVSTAHAGGRRLTVPARARPRAGRVRVSGDWSSAAFALCAAALAGDVRVLGLPPVSSQADGAIIALLRRMGARVTALGDDAWRVEAAPLSGLEVDLGASPDLFPVLAVTLASASGPSRLYGAPQLRAKESDRIATVATNLRRQGVDVVEHPDGISLAGGQPLGGGTIWSASDHRVLMAFAVGACVARAPVCFPDPDPDAVAGVSYPGFWDELRALGGRVEKR